MTLSSSGESRANSTPRRHPDLADQHDVERGVESLGDLKTDRHAAVRQAEYNWFLLPQLLQPRGELGGLPISDWQTWLKRAPVWELISVSLEAGTNEKAL